MRIIIKKIKTIRTIKAKNKLWTTKKTILQVVLKAKCIKYIYTVFISLDLLCQKFHMAIVIIKYNIVQTGANIESGGLNIGLVNNEYQGSLKLTVAKPPINEAEKVMIKKRIKVKNLFLNMIIIYSNIR